MFDDEPAETQRRDFQPQQNIVFDTPGMRKIAVEGRESKMTPANKVVTN
jgi:hypothetical protein